MSALFSWLSDSFRRPPLSQSVSAPEPVRPQPRPMTGFLATLTPEQREAALAYRGPDGHGDLRH